MSRKIILVGSANSLLNKENGYLIDYFNVVIRFNECRILGYEKYCGTKTDILCVADSLMLRRIINRQGKTKYETYIDSVDTVWYSKGKRWEGNRDVSDRSIASESKIVNFEYIDTSVDHSKESLFYYGPTPRETVASAGILAISHALLKFPNDTIYITGFDGFSTGHYYTDHPDGNPFHHNQKSPFRATAHNRVREKQIISNLLRNGIIKKL